MPKVKFIEESKTQYPFETMPSRSNNHTDKPNFTVHIITDRTNHDGSAGLRKHGLKM